MHASPKFPAFLRLVRSVALVAAAMLVLWGPAASGGEIAASEVYGTALLKTWVQAAYPPDALAQKLFGTATVRLVVDAAGAVTAARILDASDPRFGKAALAAAKAWSFTPALEGGKPVAVSMDASVVFDPQDAARKSKMSLAQFLNEYHDEIPVPSPKEPAKPTDSPAADYPDVLFDRKMPGRVLFSCTVTADGRVINPRVKAATHADFVIPAIAALSRWGFSPAKQGDVPYESETEGLITFQATSGADVDPLAANHITSPDGSAPKIAVVQLIVADPAYPYELLVKGKEGSATVQYTVDETGFVTHAAVTAATDPAFGEALLSSVEASKYEVPEDGDHAVRIALQQSHDFRPPAADTSVDDDPVARILAAVRTNSLGGSQGLDEKLFPLFRVAPRYPESLKQAGRPAGTATIEFVIDRDGRARLPHVLAASDPRFGWAAATAVAQWVFRPPLRGGKPVDVRVRIPFQFSPPTD